MADAVATTKLEEGPRNAVFHFTNQSDATGEAAVAKIDVATSFAAPFPTEFAIERIIYSTGGMAVKMLWDATVDDLACIIPDTKSGVIDYRPIGGLKNTSGAGKTGNLLFTTVGASIGDAYAITLHVKKKG